MRGLIVVAANSGLMSLCGGFFVFFFYKRSAFQLILSILQEDLKYLNFKKGLAHHFTRRNARPK